MQVDAKNRLALVYLRHVNKDGILNEEGTETEYQTVLHMEFRIKGTPMLDFGFR